MSIVLEYNVIVDRPTLGHAVTAVNIEMIYKTAVMAGEMEYIDMKSLTMMYMCCICVLNVC